ncbi:LacI family DNA-binding transcriptional regulator [Arthrobacter sp. M4]|uniref:LacI family DNA-binding transcriptional regulator n=1 Tax=Arthrobacter sp. M4 TaxID=218160 RepID=UPI001CDD1FD5|nr:LacI family DNA-binding transcriptional regulator [Arthrobacter sp. M4]MCA4134781.1 LacI family transcriptional regulator [Arthrobacter sp. M4]
MTAATGRRKPTLAAIAEDTGVSAPTVSKVINGREDVAPETRAKVLAALDAAGYRSPLQRRVTAARSTVVELVFDSMTSAYNVEILNGVLEGAGTQGAEVMISVTSVMPEPHMGPEQRAQRMVDEGRAGLIVVTSAFSSEQLSAFRRRQIPVVVIDPLNPPPSDVVSVGATNWAGGKAATEHLLGLGHQKIAYVGGPEAAECNQARLHGYMAALMAQGLDVKPGYVQMGSFRTAHGTEGLKRLLTLDERPTAVFAGSDSIAIGVLAEARRNGLNVPDDLSVVGFDSTYQAEESIPPLTSVAQPLHEMGRAALRSLLRQLNGEVLDSHRVELATQLIVRESTAAVSAEVR